VLKDPRYNKATGVDKIPAEVLNNLSNATTEKLLNTITDCNKKGMIPNEFITSKCIIIPKNKNAINYSNYRTNYILFHASKILLNVIKHRLKNKIENQI